MDQQSTAVSFPIPFSCMSVLSNHLTLAIQAGSVQLARFPALMPFCWGYKQQLHCYCKKWFLDYLWHEANALPARRMPTGLLHSNRNWIISARVRQATPGVEITCLMFPISVSLKRYFSSPWRGPKGFAKIHHLEIQRPRSWWVLDSTCWASSGWRFCWSQTPFPGSRAELGATRMVIPFVCLTRWEIC